MVNYSVYTRDLILYDDIGFLKRGDDGLWRSTYGYVYKLYSIDIPARLLSYDPKFIVAGKNVIELRYTDQFEGVWQDINGTIFALSEKEAQLDPIDRCGVGWLSFPTDSPLTPGCSPHDFKYSSKVYQLFHDRSEADLDLARDIAAAGKGTWRAKMANPFYYLTRIFGARLWENLKTRHK